MDIKKDIIRKVRVQGCYFMMPPTDSVPQGKITFLYDFTKKLTDEQLKEISNKIAEQIALGGR